MDKPIEKTALFRVFREIRVRKEGEIDLRNTFLARLYPNDPGEKA